ncbi:hypothetical protein IFM89_015529 [Coptis chinensis]|uniref:Uncharacterized protein n=1 Tax=Coptis chinensis TaxID=261450 RepID=A0A835MCT3_9MAGN|nr:hypothetical protein IFM89_015529 [Coptis chinensis]
MDGGGRRNFLVLLQQQCCLVSARTLTLPAALGTRRASLSKLRHPPTASFVFNRYKKTQADAYRPTSPGHSPGVGNNHPPGAL